MKFLNIRHVLASDLQFENEHLFDPSALGHTSGREDRSITKSSSLQRRDLHQVRTKDFSPLREQIPTTLFKRSGKVAYSQLRTRQSLSRSEAGYIRSVSERSLFTDITRTGFRLVWDYMDIICATYIASYQTSEFWANVTANARGKWKTEEEVAILVLHYGGLKLTIAGLTDVISWELLAAFAAEMLVLSRILIFGTFRVILFTHWAAWVITLVIAVEVFRTIKPQQLITRP